MLTVEDAEHIVMLISIAGGLYFARVWSVAAVAVIRRPIGPGDGDGLLTKEKIQNESERRGSRIYPALCSRIHITYSATATAKTANAMEKAACLRMDITKTVARRQARSPGIKAALADPKMK